VSALLARAISEAVNVAGFALLATVLPAGAAVYLLFVTPRRPPPQP
jgi:hypothetical protein